MSQRKRASKKVDGDEYEFDLAIDDDVVARPKKKHITKTVPSNDFVSEPSDDEAVSLRKGGAKSSLSSRNDMTSPKERPFLKTPKPTVPKLRGLSKEREVDVNIKKEESLGGTRLHTNKPDSTMNAIDTTAESMIVNSEGTKSTTANDKRTTDNQEKRPTHIVNDETTSTIDDKKRKATSSGEAKAAPSPPSKTERDGDITEAIRPSQPQSNTDTTSLSDTGKADPVAVKLGDDAPSGSARADSSRSSARKTPSEKGNRQSDPKNSEARPLDTSISSSRDKAAVSADSKRSALDATTHAIVASVTSESNEKNSKGDIESVDDVSPHMASADKRLPDKASARSDDRKGSTTQDASMGLQFDNSWIGKLSGRDLIEFAETIICEDMIGSMGGWRDTAGMSEWKRVLSFAFHLCKDEEHTADSKHRDEEDPPADGLLFIELIDLARIWESKTSASLSERVLCALVVCCSSAFSRLIGDVADVICPAEGAPLVLPSDRPTLIKKILERFSMKRIAPILQEESHKIELNLLRSVLQEQEALLSVWTSQMARITPYIEETASDINRQVDVTELRGIANRLGMPALSNQKIVTFARIALQGISSEVKFDAGGNERPILQQLQMACAYRSLKDPMLDYQEQLDLLINPDKRSVTGVSPSVLSLFNTNQKIFQTEMNPDLNKLTIPSNEMCVRLKKSEPLLTADFVTACCLLWCGDLCTSDEGNDDTLSALNVVRNCSFGPGKVGKPNLVSMSIVVKFLFPFNVSIRGISILGKAHYKHKLRPYDTTETLHTFLTNKFGMKFKKTFVTSEDAKRQKMPSDVRIFGSNTVGGKSLEIVPSKLKIIAEVCGEDSVVYIESAYVEHFNMTHSGGTSNKKNSHDRELQGTTQNILEMLAHPPLVHVKAAAPFPRPYDTAHTWSVTVMARYLTEVMELPQYENNFLRYEINGYAFLCLDANVTERCCGIEDDLHSAKIALHADNLRRKVFKTALKHLPVMLRDWHPVHIAALLHFRYNSPNSAIRVLRRQTDGNKLADMTPETIAASVSRFDCTVDEAHRTVEGLVEILEAHLTVTKGQNQQQTKRNDDENPNLAKSTEELLNSTGEIVHSSDKQLVVADETEEADEGADEVTYVIPEYSDEDNEDDELDSHSPVDRETNTAEEELEEISIEKEGKSDSDSDGHSDLDDDLPVHTKKKKMSETDNQLNDGILKSAGLDRSVKFTRALTQLYDKAGQLMGQEDDRSIGDESSTTPPSKNHTTELEIPAPPNNIQDKPKSVSSAVKKQSAPQPPASISSASTPVRRPISKKSPPEVDPASSTIIAHITALQQVVQSHSNMVKSLQQENKKLRKEREKSDTMLRATVERALGRKSREATLAAMERDTAIKSLSAVTQMYIDDVAGGLSSDDANLDSAVDDHPHHVPVSPTQAQHFAHRGREPPPPDYVDDIRGNLVSNKTEPPMRVVERVTLLKPEGRTMAEELLQDAEQEAKAWRSVLGTYRFDQQPLHIDQFNDSLTVLRRVAVAWMRLGKLIHDDALQSSDKTGTCYL